MRQFGSVATVCALAFLWITQKGYTGLQILSVTFNNQSDTSKAPHTMLQDFPLGDRPISRVGDHHEGVTGGAVGDDS